MPNEPKRWNWNVDTVSKFISSSWDFTKYLQTLNILFHILTIGLMFLIICDACICKVLLLHCGYLYFKANFI